MKSQKEIKVKRRIISKMKEADKDYGDGLG